MNFICVYFNIFADAKIMNFCYIEVLLQNFDKKLVEIKLLLKKRV